MVSLRQDIGGKSVRQLADGPSQTASGKTFLPRREVRTMAGSSSFGRGECPRCETGELSLYLERKYDSRGIVYAVATIYCDHCVLPSPFINLMEEGEDGTRRVVRVPSREELVSRIS